ncbi:MAG: NAD(P)-dependent oxidoreductase [Pirellulales bacterium]|nr:NAD(P)-dependent oxidoreductase [Pirellulales bacterium]
MRILIADKLSINCASTLAELGLDVVNQPDLTAEQIPDALEGVGAIVVRSTRVTAEALKRGRDLSLVIRAGAGVNTIDLPMASRRGIYVANCPGKNTAAVAELTIGMLVAADRQIVNATCALRNGHWEKKRFSSARGLRGRTLGILGFGSIGIAVAERAKAMGMQVLAWSRSLSQESAPSSVEVAQTALEVAKKADAITLHLGLSEQTKHIVNQEFLATVKPGAILVNAGRGELIDSEALLAAIGEKQLRVGLDVFENEPAGGKADFSNLDLVQQVTATPHIGASTAEAAEAVASEVVRIVSVFLKTGRPPVAVNLCDQGEAKCNLVVRHLNRVGVLAGLLDGLRKEEINVEEMDNVIFAGGEAACCTLLLSAEPSRNFLNSLDEQEAILSSAMRNC